MKKFSILIPTRKRTTLLKETLLTIENQTKNKNLFEIIIGIDTDDQETKKFIEDYKKNYQIDTIITVMERGKGYQDHALRLKKMVLSSNGEYLIQYSDDIKLLTPSWDSVLEQKIDSLPPDKVFLLFPAHNQKNTNWPLVPIISKKWFNLTGKFTNCIEVDTELLIISTLLKRKYKINNINIHHSVIIDQTFSEGRKIMLSGKNKTNSIFSIKNFFLILMDFQILKENLNNKNISTNNNFKKLKFYFINFCCFFYYLNIIKKELKIYRIQDFFKIRKKN